MPNWNADRTTVPKPVFQERLQRAMEEDCRRIAGNYGSTLKPCFAACDTIFFLDHPQEVCLTGIDSRKGKTRSDMPWFEAVDEQDDDFIEFIKNYNHVSRPQVLELRKEFSDKDIYIFQNRESADRYLSQV